MSTPARKQYLRIKKKHPDAVLLFRMGDFYETFDNDARLVSKELEIALTSREMGKGIRVPLAGIPYHALEGYLAKLIKKGYRVAICEQTSDAATSRGIVDREVVRVVTPGTVIEDSILDQSANNYLAAAVTVGDRAGLAYVDITTSEFATSEFAASHLSVELARLNAAELLVPDDASPLAEDVQRDTNANISTTQIAADMFRADWAREALHNALGVTSLEGFGCEHLPLAVQAAGAIVRYLEDRQSAAVGQLKSLYTYSTEEYMVLDRQTRRNLELFEGGRWGDTQASLLAVLDRTKTPMGARQLRRWIGRPLLDVGELTKRQDAVEWFHSSAIRRSRVIAILGKIADIERLINKIRLFSATPRDVVSLGRSLAAAPQIWEILAPDDDAQKVEWLIDEARDSSDAVDLIGRAIEDSPPFNVGDGGVIRRGFSKDLDELRQSARNAQDYIASLEKTERERTGIKSLKVGYNKVFGYYIEISRPNLSQAPEEYIRRQTLVNAERFITPQMKEYESLILNAQERIAELETNLYRQVCQQIADYSDQVMATARAVSLTDAFASLAEVAERHAYVRPELNDDDAIVITQGRHPVVEQALDSGQFVPNDARLSTRNEQIIMLTGPNMAGKSTFLRQVALITLMAQIGSFVPAESAFIGVVDRIFTRVGLQDDLSTGQSTFMIEMLETASILNHATTRSLVVLDEIGRGTSTYDGLAIARAVAEFIHNHPRAGCKTLFATHYHELTQLADVLPRVRNYNVAVAEEGGEVVFLHRIVSGGADRSYGVYVARLAGMPAVVVTRAWEVLKDLEDTTPSTRARGSLDQESPAHPQAQQLPLIQTTHAVIDDILALDVSSMTPLEAINKLYEFQDRAK